jgi:hypothetical protein
MPDYAIAAYNMALMLVDCPDPKMQNVDEAVRYADWAQRTEDVPTVNSWLILATVYTRAGRLRSAVLATRSALELAYAAEDPVLIQNLNKQLRALETLAEDRRNPQ